MSVDGMALAARWVHIGSACLAIGAPFFVRFALLPAAQEVLDDATHQKLRAAVNARWKHVVYALITLFLLSGFYNYLIVARWKQFPAADQKLYHMLMGMKILAAFVVFFLASALAGRAAALAFLRAQAKRWLLVLLALGGVILALGAFIRFLPRG